MFVNIIDPGGIWLQVLVKPGILWGRSNHYAHENKVERKEM